MDFFKYHALGNDYLVVDPQKTSIELTPQSIRLICHRNFGVGSDGILFGPILEHKQMRVRIYNPDGSEAEKSGNGIRIFSRYLHETGYVSKSAFTLHTLGGEVRVRILKDDASLIKVDMGCATFRSDEIPVSGESRDVIDETIVVSGKPYRMTCLSIGNPHCVIPLDDISGELAKDIGPEIENHTMFPNRINVQLIKMIDRNNIRIEIWERGAGYTLASGSSSCAAACAARKLGLADATSTVHMPGGQLAVEIDGNRRIHLTGPASSVAAGNFSADLRMAIMEA